MSGTMIALRKAQKEIKQLRKQNTLMVLYLRRVRDCGLTDEDWRDVNELIGDEQE